MHSEIILCLLSDLMDYTKSPQASSFNQLFNSLDVYYIFKLHLSNFISKNSPYKTKAMNLLHQYVENKGMECDTVSLFFSEDASKNNIKPELSNAHE